MSSHRERFFPDRPDEDRRLGLAGRRSEAAALAASVLKQDCEPDEQISSLRTAQGFGHSAQVPEFAEGQTEVFTQRTTESSTRGCFGSLQCAEGKEMRR